MLRLIFLLFALFAGVRLESVEIGRTRDDYSQSGISGDLILNERTGNDGETERAKREFLYRTPLEEDIDVTSEEFPSHQVRKRCNPIHRHKSLLFDDSDTLYRLIDLLNEERNVQRNLNRRRSYIPYPRSADRQLVEEDDPVTTLTIPGSVDDEPETDLAPSDMDLEPIAYKLAMMERKNRLHSRECDQKRMICYCQDEDCTNPEKSGIVRLALPKQPFSLRKKPKRIGYKDKIKPTKGSYLDHLHSLQSLPVLVPLAQGQSNVMNGMQFLPVAEHPETADFGNVQGDEPERYHIPFAVSHPNRPGYLVGSVQVMSQDRQQGKKCGMHVGQARKKCSGSKTKDNNKPVYGKQLPEENVGSAFETRKQEAPVKLFDFQECMKHHTADVCRLASVQRPTEGVTKSSDSENSKLDSQGHRVTYYESRDHSGNGINEESTSLKPKVEHGHYAPHHTPYEEGKDRKIEHEDLEVSDSPANKDANYGIYESHSADKEKARMNTVTSEKRIEESLHSKIPESPTGTDGKKNVHYNELSLSNPTAKGLPDKNHPPDSTEGENSMFVKDLIKKVINDIALNRSETVGNVIHMRNMNEPLHPSFGDNPALREMILSPPLERTVVNRVNNIMSQLVGAKKRLPIHQVRKYLHHVVGGPGAASEKSRFTVEEHQLDHGTWSPHKVSLLQQDSKKGIDPASRLRDRVMYFLNNPMHRETMNHPVARNMIAESIKNDMAEHNEDSTGLINDNVISRFLDKVFGVSGGEPQRPIIDDEENDAMEPADEDVDEEDVVGSKQYLNKPEAEAKKEKEDESRGKEMEVLKKDQSKVNSVGKEVRTESSTSGILDRKLSVTEHPVKMSTYKDEERLKDETSSKFGATTGTPVSRDNKLSTNADDAFSTKVPYETEGRSQTMETEPIKYYSADGRKLEYVKSHSLSSENGNTESPTVVKKVTETEDVLYSPTESTKAVGKARTLANKVSESGDAVENPSRTSVNPEEDGKKSAFTENSSPSSGYETRTETTEAVEGNEEKLTTVHTDPIDPENKRLTSVVTETPENKFAAGEKMYRTGSGHLSSTVPSTGNINETRTTFARNKYVKPHPEAESTPTETSSANIKMGSENYTPSSETGGEYAKSTISDERDENSYTENVENGEGPVRNYGEGYTTANYIPTERTENKKEEIVGANLKSEPHLNERIYPTNSEYVTPGILTTETQSQGHAHTERIPIEESAVKETSPIPEVNLEEREKLLHYERNKYAQSPTERAEHDASMTSHPSTIPHYQERLTSVYYTRARLPAGSTETIRDEIIDQTHAPDAREKESETEFEKKIAPNVGKAKLANTNMLSEEGTTKVPESELTWTEKYLTSEPGTIIIKNFSPSSTGAMIEQDERREPLVYEHHITEMPKVMTSEYPHIVHTYNPKTSNIETDEEVLPMTYSTEHAHTIFGHYPSSTDRTETEKSEPLYYTSSPYERTHTPIVTLTVRHETQPEIEEMTANPRPTFATERSVEKASRKPINYNNSYKDALTVGRDQFEVTERTAPPELGTNYKVTVYYTPTEKESKNRPTESTATVPSRYRTYTERHSTSPAYEIRSEIRLTENPQKVVTGDGSVGRIVSEEQKSSPQVIESSTSLSERRMQMQTRMPSVSEKVTQTPNADKFEEQNFGPTLTPETRKTDQQLPIIYYSPTEGKYNVIENSATDKPTGRNKNLSFTIREMVDKANAANAHRTTVSTETESSKMRWLNEEFRPTEQILGAVHLIENSTPSVERKQGQPQESSSVKKGEDVTTAKSGESVMPIVYYSPSEQKYKLYNDPGTRNLMSSTERSRETAKIKNSSTNQPIVEKSQDPRASTTESSRIYDSKSNYHTTKFFERTSTPATIQREKENTEILPDFGELGQNEKDLFVDDSPIAESSTLNDGRPRVSTNYERVTEPDFRQMSTKSRYRVQPTSETPQSKYKPTASYNENLPISHYSTTEGILKYSETEPSRDKNAEMIENMPGEQKGKVHKTYFDSSQQTISPVQKANARQMIIAEDKKVDETTTEIGQTTQTEALSKRKENMPITSTQNSAQRHEITERIMTDSPIVAETRFPELTKAFNGDANETYEPMEQDLDSNKQFEATTRDFGYFGRLSPANEASTPKELSDLESSDLYYIGDGVKLPLEIRRLNDGSFALSISSKICKNFLEKECPCCVPRNGKILRTKRTVRGKRSSRNSIELAMPVSSFAKQYNLALDLHDEDQQLNMDRRDRELSLEERNNKKLNALSGHDPLATDVFKIAETEGNGEGVEDTVGYKYNVNNPFLDRSKFVKKIRDEHVNNDGQRSDRGYYADRMEDMRNFLLWLKALILASD